tara:strand:+ start:7100 stop:8068 length:969 start_codon:yes stop_codon:yes gene_type:complete
MIIAFISNPLNFFPLFALGEKRNCIFVINASNYPKNINHYLKIKRDQFNTRLICIPFIISRLIIKTKFVLRILLLINNFIYKKHGQNIISIAVPTLMEKPINFLYDDIISYFKTIKIYEFGDFIGVRCSLSSLNKDHCKYKEQKRLLLTRRAKLNSQIINASLFEKFGNNEKLQISSQYENYLNSIKKLIKKNQDLDKFIENYFLKQSIKENMKINILVLRSVGRKENQAIIEIDKLIDIKKNELVIIRPHPRDLIGSKVIKYRLKKQLNNLRNILEELEIKNIKYDLNSFIPIEILILHSFENNYFINIIGKESVILLNKN